MGLKLQKLFITFFLLVVILLMEGFMATALSQIYLEDDTSLEIRFSQGESERDQGTLTVGLNEINSILADDFVLVYDEWQPFSDDASVSANSFITDGNQYLAPGRLEIKDSPEQTFFITSFKNNATRSIDNLIAAYDFMHNFQNSGYKLDFKLMYKVNDREWTDVPSGVISSASLTANEEPWASFSIQLNINDIFLRPSDLIHLMWVIEADDDVAEKIPMVLQRMEVDPQFVQQDDLDRGDLIITEILPRSDVNGTLFEYIEVYNPGEQRINLKGVELFTSIGSKVIQKEIYVEPYQFTVISNVDLSNLESVENSYFYNGSILAENRGRIGLERGGKLIASATYEALEPGLSLELNRVSRAFDGYSSLQDFSGSQFTYFQDLFGSPGSAGSTVPMFKKELIESGYYILSLPGITIDRLNRHSSLKYFSLKGEATSLNDLEPYTPFLAHKTNDSPLTIFAETVNRINSDLLPAVRFTTGSDFISNPILTAESSSSVQKSPEISNITPVIQKWNSNTQKFELSRLLSNNQELWNPVIINREVTEHLGNSDNRLLGPVLDRFIEFTLESDGENSSRANDVAILGFMDSPAQYTDIRYDLPKLEFVPESNSQFVKQPLIYLSSSHSEDRYNSFTHLPFDIRSGYEIGLGIQMIEDAGSATIQWKLMEDIPDEWIITLVDVSDETKIDMREVNEYHFRYGSSSSRMSNENIRETPKINSINPDSPPRFSVIIQPYASYTENSQDEETPDRIELRPNYPNPFNPSTNINFFLPEERTVRVGIYNIVGQQVALLLDDTVQPGEHSLVWDASDKPSGIYIVQLETSNRIFTRKITLIK